MSDPLDAGAPHTAENLERILRDYLWAVAQDRLLPAGADAAIGEWGYGDTIRRVFPSDWIDYERLGRMTRGHASFFQLQERVHEHQRQHGISSLMEETVAFEPFGWSITAPGRGSYLALIGGDGKRLQQAANDQAAAFLDLALGAAAEAGWARIRELSRDELCEDGAVRQFIYYEEWMPADLRQEIGRTTSAYANLGAGGGGEVPKDQALVLNLHQGRFPGDDDLQADEATTATFLLVHPDAADEVMASEGIA